jgi:hypothetical protein
MTDGAQRPFAFVVIAIAVAAILACDGAGEFCSFPDRLHGVLRRRLRSAIYPG